MSFLLNPFVFGGFSPLNLSPALWLDAADASTVTSSGSPLTVSEIRDKSGNGYDFTQATSANQPEYVSAGLNGKDVLRFDGNDNLSVGATDLARNVSGVTIYLVAKFTSNPTSRKILFRISRPDLDFARTDLVVGETSQKARYGGRTLDADSFQTITGSTTIATSWLKYTQVFDYSATTLTGFIGTSQDAITTSFQSASTTSDTASVNTTLGSSAGGSNFFNGDIAEVLVFHSAHDSATRTEIWDYLQDKWGV